MAHRHQPPGDTFTSPFFSHSSSSCKLFFTLSKKQFAILFLKPQEELFHALLGRGRMTLRFQKKIPSVRYSARKGIETAKHQYNFFICRTNPLR